MTWESMLTSGWAMPEGQTTQAGDRQECIAHTPGFQAKIATKVTGAHVEGVCSQHCQLGGVSLCDAQDGEGKVLGFEDIQSNRLLLDSTP